MTTAGKNLKEQILVLLADEKKEDAEKFASYCLNLLTDVKTDKTLRNPWMQFRTAQDLATLFKRVKAEGLTFDGKHISLQSTGVSYDYIAYKNKMLLVYPETKFDMDVVKTGDTFNVDKVDGDIVYRHVITKPLETAEFKNIEGAYCIIKNSRGVFLTTLSKEDIAKHRKVAKGDFIWSAWFKEMVLKTVLKKGFKYHFDDIVKNIDEMDNENIDLEKLELPDEEDDTKYNNEKARLLELIKGYDDLAKLRHFFESVPKEFQKDEDIIEACKSQKLLCKKPTK